MKQPNSMRKVTLVTTFLFCLVLPQTGYAFNDNAAKADISSLTSKTAEATILQAYEKFTLYNRAANRAIAAEKKYKYTAEDDIAFQIMILRRGPIEEIHNNSIGGLVTRPGGNVIEIMPYTRKYKDGPEHTMYMANWINYGYLPSPLEDWDNTSISQILQMIPTLKATEYISYKVTLRYEGKNRRYHAIALVHNQYQTGVALKIYFIDNIVGVNRINQAFNDQRPTIKSPWERYIHSEEYKKYLNTFQQANGDYHKANELARISEDGWYESQDSGDMEKLDSAASTTAVCAYTNYTGPPANHGLSDTADHICGQHSASSQLQGYCQYSGGGGGAPCTGLCQVRLNSSSRSETGFTWSACHVQGQEFKAADDSGPRVTNCSAGYGVASKACLFCLCNVTITISAGAGSVTITSDGIWTYPHSLTHSCAY